MSAEKFKPLHFSTEGRVGLKALASWRELCGQELMKVEMDPLGGVPFSCAATLRALPGLAIASITSSPNRLTRTKKLAADGNDDFLFVVPTTGRTVISAHGREVSLGSGDATLLSAADPNVSVIPSQSRFLTLAIPAAVIAPYISMDESLTTLIPAATDVLQLLVGYVASLNDEMMLSAPDTRRQFVTHIHDLVALALGAGRDAKAMAEGRGLRAARLRAIKTEIIENLERRELSVDMLAVRHRISDRYIRRLFENEGTTFTEFLLIQRLKRAHALLTDVRYADRTISQIAFDAGFSDLSYFNKSFRRHFGMTPSSAR
ncbi:MAG TPA: AraC family transcriptional regulator [Lacipirellulaceae bacterium]